MGFLMPKVQAPPPIPPAPPPPAVPEPVVPDPVIRPNTVVQATSDAIRSPKKANQKTNIKTTARGVIEDAPLSYRSLLGTNRSA